ncbi:MAG: CrcB family protein [Idiomarina sp.]|nr:CrcB family protein [Idiomarina sp.]
MANISADNTSAAQRNRIYDGLRFTLAVALGGALGAVLRVLITVILAGESGSILQPTEGLSELFAPLQFPLATLLINIVGSFALGLVIANRVYTQTNTWSAHQEAWFLFITSGFWSAFTTFSAFSHDVLQLWVNGAAVFGFWWPPQAVAGMYLLASVVISLAAVMLAFALSHRRHKTKFAGHSE